MCYSTVNNTLVSGFPEMNPDRKNEKKPNREGEKREKPKLEGATQGLAVFDYSGFNFFSGL
jgi:hypothetical protein